MKKILSYILISFVIFTNLFAPFSVILNQGNNVEIKSNKAEAASGIKVSNTISYTDTTISGTVRVVWGNVGLRTSNSGVMVFLLDPSTQTSQGAATVVNQSSVALTKVDPSAWTASELGADEVDTGNFSFTVKPSSTYEIKTSASQNIVTWTSILTTAATIGNPVYSGVLLYNGVNPYKFPAATDNGTTISDPFTLTTNAAGNTKVVEAGTQISVNTDALLPMCDILHSDTWGGCVGVALYWVLFKPSSFIFALSGKLLDITVDYSTKDTSYRSPFVVQGWGVIRDFCNMFFIFVMLYIAISTILSIHGFNTKQMIINVVIIGLFINFSLFATQVIIDASNIMTRVFYNSNTIAIGPMKDGVIQDQRGTDGEIKLSEALVAKINPQKLILQAAMSDNVPTTLDAGSDTKTQSNGVTASTFIIICIMASIVNIVGLLTFLSSSLIFVSRVVGLWLAMIFAPLAFFSYIVPQLQDIKMVGWKKWWPDTINMAFLAPVFVFFMYIIIKFLNTGLGIIQNDKASGMDFILGIIIPFIFIMILLLRAKSVAKDMSGEIGQSITNGIAAVGGLALGGAALGAAFVGRSTVGLFMKGASTGDTAARRLAAERASGVRDPSIRTADRIKGTLQRFSGYDWAQRQAGARLNANQHDIEHATHSRHLLDNAANVVAPGKKWEELNGEQRTMARTNMERDRYIRENRNAANTPLANLGNRNWNDMTTIERNYVNTQIAAALATQTTDADVNIVRAARRKVGLGENIIQSTVGGSFDIRNLSKIVAGDQDRGLNKLATGLTSTLASGMRGVIKQSSINYGEGQKNFVKDLGNTITEALKSTTIKVDLSHVGDEKKEDAHGGGHH